MEKNTFEDYSGGGTNLREVLIKCRDEKTILKKRPIEETSKINLIIRS